VEQLGRVAHFLSRKRMGWLDEEAAQSVRKYLFNYDELTPFERKLRNVVFFYTWTRNALPLMFKESIEHTGKMAAMFRLGTAPTIQRGAVPRWMRETAAIPSGTDAQGATRYITGLGLPIEELSKLDISGAEPGMVGAIRRMGEKAAALMLPPLKAPLEAIAGRDFYLNKPISEADRAYSFLRYAPDSVKKLLSYRKYKTPSKYTVERMNPEIAWLLRASPLSRTLSTAHKAVDPRRGVVDKVLALASGVRSTSIDAEDARLQGIQQLIEQALSRAKLGGTSREFRGFYASGPKAERDPRIMELIRDLRRVAQKRSERLKRRR